MVSQNEIGQINLPNAIWFGALVLGPLVWNN